MRATVLVRPKQGILDPQGEAVLGSLRKLGFDVGGVRVGRLIDVELAAPDTAAGRVQVERMCTELLANPLIESVEIEVVDEQAATADAVAGAAASDDRAAALDPEEPAA